MLRILQIPDLPWSIGQLCNYIRKYNPQIEWKLIYCPPRDIEDHLEEIRQAIKDVDIVDFQYWNVAWQLCEKIPELKDKKKILTYHTMPNKQMDKWKDFDALVVKTNAYYNTLNQLYPLRVRKIENVPDFDYFEWIEDYSPKEMAVGYAGRVVPWKGLKEIARACYELGYPLYIMGKLDKLDYWNGIPKEHKDNMRYDFYQCPDEQRLNFFKSIALYVGNSEPDHEGGTLPFLEALACGVPVVTTPNGMAADIVEDERDVLLFEYGNYEQMKEKIKRAMEDLELRKKLRNNGWQAVKRFTPQYLAKEYEKLYNSVMFPDQSCVSVIIPATYDREDLVRKIIDALSEQTHKNIEAVVVWDEVEKREIIFDAKITVKQIYTEREGYNLAMARNLGVVEAIGDILVFCDSRFCPDKNAVKNFVDAIMADEKKIWFFGEKGGGKKSFVENFSAIRRKHLIMAGMFNERIDVWGGASQELRTRYREQDFKLEYLPSAKATEMRSSKMTPQKRKDMIRAKLLNYKLFGDKTL